MLLTFLPFKKKKRKYKEKEKKHSHVPFLLSVSIPFLSTQQYRRGGKCTKTQINYLDFFSPKKKRRKKKCLTLQFERKGK